MARKEKWRPRLQQKFIEGHVITPPAGVAARYKAELQALITRMSDEYEREIKKLFAHEDVQAFFAQDDSPSAQARILTNYLSRKFIRLFNKRAKPLAEKFTGQSDKANKAAVRESLKKMSLQFAVPRENLSEHLNENLSAIVTENVNLIKSIGQQYLAQVNGSVMRSITQGTGLSQLTKEIRAHKAVSMRRAEIIALDQTRKTTQTLSRVRYQDEGIEEYTWRHTSGSVEPRELHIDYDGRVFRFDTPVLVQKATKSQPAMYGFPGTAINCRCRAVAVIRPQKD
jgi:SPP1 gp7 family putative phage head morphogenesis protein